MHILLVHNFYQQAGGEDEVFRAESQLLRDRGHDVGEFVVHNDDVAAMGRLKLLAATVWNADAAGRLRERVAGDRVEVVHFHNTFPLISPAAYRAAKSAGAAVVQTLHNYRLLCPSATFFRDGRVCEDCLRKPLARAVPWPGVMHKCYRGNLGASAATAGMLAVHRAAGTYRHAVDRYITLSEFGRAKFADGGLPAGKIVVKANFLPDPGEPGDGGGGHALFAGRLTEEKGVGTMLEAWRPVEGGPVPPRLVIVGDGPMRPEVERAATASAGRVEYVGRLAPGDVLGAMRSAACLVFPSRWYEAGVPRVAIESFAAGTPVVAADVGTMSVAVRAGVNGVKVPPGDAAALRRAVVELVAAPDGPALRRATRAYFDAHHAAGANYERLMAIYEDALAARAPKSV